MIEPVLSDDALLAAIESAPAGKVHLWWLGQSGYLVRWNDTRVLIDPYLSDSLTRKYANTDKPHVRMSRRVVDPARLEKINIVTSSHGHTDHLDAETYAAVRRANAKAPIFVAPRAIRKLAVERWGGEVDVTLSDGESYGRGDMVMHAVPAAHETLERDARGDSLYLGYVFRFGEVSIYHSGDTVVHPKITEALERFSINVAILPINGKVGNMSGADAAKFANQIGARLVVPCHYDMFEFNTADPNAEFIPECERLRQAHRVLRLGERLTL